MKPYSFMAGVHATHALWCGLVALHLGVSDGWPMIVIAAVSVVACLLNHKVAQRSWL